MPTYDLIDNNTGEHFSRFMKISEKEQYLKDNPHITQTYTTPPMLGDPVRLGVRKIDNGFREVLQKIHSRTPGSKLNTFTNI